MSNIYLRHMEYIIMYQKKYVDIYPFLKIIPALHNNKHVIYSDSNHKKWKNRMHWCVREPEYTRPSYWY